MPAARATPHEAPHETRLLVAIAAMCLLLFATDLAVPLGFNLPLLYVVPVLGGLWSRRAWLAPAVAGGATVLIAAGGLLSPGDLAWVGLVNRPLDVFVIWTSAALVGRRVRRAEELRQSLKDLADVTYALDQSAIVAATDRRGLITYANDKFCEISKYSRGELIGQDHRIVNSGYHPKEFIRDLWQTITSGRLWQGELRNRAKDGTYYWVDTTIVPFLDESGRPYRYLAIRSDITERKRAEEQLREQAAFTRLGQMAAVVAHEVKNPLAGARGALEVIGSRLPAGSTDRAIVGDVVARLDGLNQLVQDLLLFARPQKPKPSPVPILDLVRETSALLARDVAMAGLKVEIEGENVVLAADAGQLKAALLNVLLNGAQAMGGTGPLNVSVAKLDGSCQVAVRDRGPGIPPDVRDRIFEPFFSTKHRGTGLGLSLARRVVEMHGGRIDVACPSDGGTLVTVALPLST